MAQEGEGSFDYRVLQNVGNYFRRIERGFSLREHYVETDEELCLKKNSRFCDGDEAEEIFGFGTLVPPKSCRVPASNSIYQCMRYISRKIDQSWFERPRSHTGLQMVFYSQQLDRRGIWLDRIYTQKLSEVRYYRQRGWRKRYPALARICEFQEKVKAEHVKETTGIYACPCPACEWDGSPEPEVLSEGEELPGDWASVAPWEVRGAEQGSGSPEEEWRQPE